MSVNAFGRWHRRVIVGLACATAIASCAAGPCQEWAKAAQGQVQNADPSAAADPPGNAPPLYLLTYDHGGLVLWGRDHFLRRLRNAAQWLDRYPGFKIGLDNEAYTYDALAEQDPQVLDEIRRYLKRYRGRFGIGTCTYGQPLSVFINEESNIRQIQYALEADRRHLGTAPDVYLMSEHAMHSQMPQILSGFGFKGSIMRTHFMMYGYNPTFDTAIGWWVGVDGSRIPTVPTYTGQGAQFGRTTKDNWILTRYPSDQCRASLEDFRKEFAHIQPLLATRADDAGLRREELVRMVEGKPGFRWMLLEEIFPAFPAPSRDLTTAPNDFRVRMPWGYCGNEIWNQSRRAEVSVLTAERLAAMEHLLGGSDRDAELQGAWKNLLVAQHHDIQICGLLEDARKFLSASLDSSGKVREASLGLVAGRMAGGQPAQITVFNPLSWDRTQWVEVSFSLPRGAADALVVRQGSKRVPSAILSADRHGDGSIRHARLALLADVPALGFASYALVPTGKSGPKPAADIEIAPGKLIVKTPHLTVSFHPDGGISSIVDPNTGQEFLRPGRRSGIFAAKVDGRDCKSRGRWAIETARGGASWAVAREAGLIGGIPYRLEIVIPADAPRLDCRATFHFDGQRLGRLSDNKRDPASGFVHEEKLRFKLFPAVGDSAGGVRDLPFAIAETSDRYLDGNYWTALTDGKQGVAIFNRGTMGSVREQDGGFSLPLAFAMYYVWGTRMLNGDFTFDFAVYPFTGSWQQTDLHRRALEYNYPMVTACSKPGDGQLGNRLRLLKVDSPGALVSAIYAKGGQTYVRMYEYRGKTGQATLRYPAGTAGLVEVDLADRDKEAISSPIQFRPWQIRTIRLQPQE